MPATKFNGLPVGDGAVGAVTRRLLQAWSELVWRGHCGTSAKTSFEERVKRSEGDQVRLKTVILPEALGVGVDRLKAFFDGDGMDVRCGGAGRCGS